MEFELNRIILESGMKKKYIAAKVNMRPDRFSKIIHGDVKASLHEKRSIAGVLERQVDELFRAEDDDASGPE